jgi:TIR domain
LRLPVKATIVRRHFGASVTSKPTLFLSHSSTDAVALLRLKEILADLSVGAVDIFLSSDGQSIPFGKNWVHEVEHALQRAKLMFVFISSAALRSAWVPFESGYAYARDIRVVPVGIGGVDLGAVRPPLALLQGFNLHSPAAMNNLVATINDVFGLRIAETLGANEFAQTFARSAVTANSSLGTHTALVHEIVFPTNCIHTPESAKVLAFFNALGIETQVAGDHIHSPGLSMPLHRGHVDIRVDPLLTALTFPIVEKLIPFLAEPEFNDTFSFEVSFLESVRATEQTHKLSARIYGTRLAMAGSGQVRLDELYLRIRQHHALPGASPLGGATFPQSRPSGSSATCTYKAAVLTKAPLAEALDLLFATDALFVDESPT